MRDFLLALAALFAGIAHFWNETAISIGGLGALGDLLSIGYYELSVTFSNAAQLCLDGADAAANLQTQVDDIQDDLAGALLESALGQAITALWPTFPQFLDDPGEWLLDTIADAFPDLATLLYFPETWLLDALEDLLPIQIIPGGFETFTVGDISYYGNDEAGTGQGFAVVIPAGDWAGVSAQFYAMTGYGDMAPLSVYSGATPYQDVDLSPTLSEGQAWYQSLFYQGDGLAEGITWRVLTRAPGSFAFASQAILTHRTDPMLSQWLAVIVIGGTGPATWTLDWSGFITWLEEAFLSVSGILYALLERIVRYFWEGVY